MIPKRNVRLFRRLDSAQRNDVKDNEDAFQAESSLYCDSSYKTAEVKFNPITLMPETRRSSVSYMNYKESVDFDM